jgi:hypothetical protein
MALILSPAGCVCDIAQSNQFDNVQGEAQTLCGPWTVAALKYAGLPGKGALASGAGHENPIDDFAEVEFEKYIGPNVTSNHQGSLIENMHQFFHDAGNLHYVDIDAINDSSVQADDNDRIRRALRAGYPVAVTVHEPSVISKKLGHCPYSWQPALGDITHIIPVIGIDRDGDFIVGDQANVVEGWPQTYLASQIHFHWASVVQLVGPDAAKPWLKPIPGNDPRTWPQGFNAQLFAQKGTIMAGVPQGWHDDGTTLTAPNGHKVVHGFRVKVLAGWDAQDVPLEEERQVAHVEAYYPSDTGAVQTFNFSRLCYTSARGVYKMGIGNELLGCEKALAACKATPGDATVQQELDAANQKLAQVKAVVG